MPLPTISDVQAVDPVLTNLLVAYMQADTRFVASRVFPGVPVDKDSGTYYIFSKKYWFLDEMEQRAAGDPFARTGFGVSSSTYATLQYALAIPIADETRANSQVPMDLEEAALRHLAQKSLLRKERQFSTDFMATSVWANDDTTATDWDDFAAGDPVSNALTAARTISDNSGVGPNKLVVGSIVHDALVNHPDILDRIKYTTQAVIGNVEAALAAVMGVEEYLVSRASYNSANEGQDFTAAAIIDDDALFVYTAGAPSIFSPSGGYTFYWPPGGGMGSVNSVREDNRDSDLIKHKEQWDQKAVATDVGYFFSGIV